MLAASQADSEDSPTESQMTPARGMMAALRVCPRILQVVERTIKVQGDDTLWLSCGSASASVGGSACRPRPPSYGHRAFATAKSMLKNCCYSVRLPRDSQVSGKIQSRRHMVWLRLPWSDHAIYCY